MQTWNELHHTIVRAAQWVTNVWFVSTWRAHKKLCEVQCLETHLFFQHTSWLKVIIVSFFCHLRPDVLIIGTVKFRFPLATVTEKW